MGRFNMISRGEAQLGLLNALVPSISVGTTGSTGNATLTTRWAGSTLSLLDDVSGLFSINSTTGVISWGAGSSVGHAFPQVQEVKAGFVTRVTTLDFTFSAPSSVPLLGPASGFNGTYGSGATGGVAKYVYGTRTKPRPAIRPLTMHMDVFTSNKRVFFAADDGPALTDALADVYAWYEGAEGACARPQWYDYTDEWGQTASVYAWAIDLNHAAATALASLGRGCVVAKAIPTNPNHEPNVSREIMLINRTTAYDVKKVVKLDGSGDFTSVTALLNYMGTVPNTFVYGEIGDDGNYNINCSGQLNYPCNHVNIIGKAAGKNPTLGAGGIAVASTSVDGIRWKGLKADKTLMAYNLHSAFHTQSGGVLQFEGMDIYNGDGGGLNGLSGTGADILKDGEPPSQTWIVNWDGADIQAKDCRIHDSVGYGTVGFQLVLNCDLADVSGSGYEICKCVHGGTATRVGGYLSTYTTHHPGLRVNYGGAGTPSVRKTATNGRNGNLELRVNGSTVANIPTSANPTMAQMAAAINTYGNSWSASDIHTVGLSSAYLSKSTNNPADAIADTPLVAGTIDLTLIQDNHSNTAVWHGAAGHDQVIFEFVKNLVLVSSSAISFDGGTFMRDSYVRNYFSNDESAAYSATPQAGYLSATFTHAWMKHVTVQGGVDYNTASRTYINGVWDADSCIVDSFFDMLYWAGVGANTDRFHGLAINRAPTDALPVGADAASKYLNAVAESTISSAAGVPVDIGGSSKLKLSPGTDRWAGAFLPTALVTAPNHGWNV